jgi:deoxyribodipyrimidine photolyase
MRQLWSTGWCHNRVRVVASSFMVKHLLLPWQWGLKHLWDCQIDADLEADALGW